MKTTAFFKSDVKTMTFLVTVMTIMVFTACSDDNDFEWEVEHTTRGILGATADTYNINDKDFTADTWRQQDAIYLYDEEGRYKTDDLGREGYTLVNLPWWKGDKQTNLPNGFCDDITRENGWEMVLNRCGSRSIKNANFFALYNKYTGILRFFFYMPEKFTSGNDHVWEVTMTDNMARNTTLRYGIPQDLKMKDKDLVGLSGDRTISEYIAPWVSRLSQDGYITPNTGWWAFDVDMSLYSKKSLNEDDCIMLQMRSMNTGSISLNSQISANIDGSIKADIDLLQSQHLGNSAMGMVTRAGSIGGNLYKMVTSIETQKWGEALSAGINMSKTVANICGIKTEGSQDIQGTLDGTVALAMTGTIATEGIIRNSTVTSGVASPTFYLKDFDYTNAPAMGEGIWNLETSPVVYYTDAAVDYRSEEFHTKKKWTRPVLSDKTATFWDGMKYVEVKSPFGGVGESKEPARGRVCYFDPASIKVTLNDKVFTEDEIRGAKVYAVCGVRKGAKFGSTENYRKAIGLGESKITAACSRVFSNRPFDEAPFDGLCGYSDMMGMKTVAKFAAEDFDDRRFGVFGRGNDNYLIEPQALHSGNGADWMPACEVTVTLVVEHDGKPIVYSRSYLPEYKEMKMDEMKRISVMETEKDMPENYVADIYKQQTAHYRMIYNWTRRTTMPTTGTPYKVHDYNWSIAYDNARWYEVPAVEDKASESFCNILDGNPKTKWCSRIKTRNASEATSVSGNGASVWFCEFETPYMTSPDRYTLVTAADNSVFPTRRPKSWALYGKIDGKWQLLDRKDTNASSPYVLPETNMTEKTFIINREPGLIPQTNLYRFEVYSTWDNSENSYMQLAELRFSHSIY